MDEQISIKVNLAGRTYPLRIVASEEELVRKAVRLVNEKEKEYMGQFAMRDLQDAFALMALELIIRVEKNQISEKDREQKIGLLSELIDRSLA